MASFLSKFFGGTPAREERTSLLDPDQQNIRNLIEQGVRGEGPFADLFGGMSPDQIQEIVGLFESGVADPARKQFAERIIPGLEQRAIQAGAQSSSGLLRQIGVGQSDLEDRLSAQRSQAVFGERQGALNRKSSAIDTLLRPTSQSRSIERQPGFFENLVSRASPSLTGGLSRSVEDLLGLGRRR